VRHRYAASNKRGMHTYSQAVPRMPWVQDLSELNNMGVVLFTCTTRIALTSGWRRRHPRGERQKQVPDRILKSIPSRDWADCITDTESLRNAPLQEFPTCSSG